MQHKLDLATQPILRDFDRFLDFFGEAQKPLTKGQGVLVIKDLLALNSKMSKPVEYLSSRPQMKAFSMLSMFFYVAVEMGLLRIRKDSISQKNTAQIDKERVSAYDSLPSETKYLALLEGFYWRMDWDIAYDCRDMWNKDFYKKLARKKIDKRVTISNGNLKREGTLRGPSYLFYAEVLEAFGFFDLEWDSNLKNEPVNITFPIVLYSFQILGRYFSLF